MTQKEIFCAAIADLGAGGGTMGSVLQAFSHFLLKEDPVHLRRLREEIDAARVAGLLSLPVVSNAEVAVPPSVCMYHLPLDLKIFARPLADAFDRSKRHFASVPACRGFYHVWSPKRVLPSQDTISPKAYEVLLS